MGSGRRLRRESPILLIDISTERVRRWPGHEEEGNIDREPNVHTLPSAGVRRNRPVIRCAAQPSGMPVCGATVRYTGMRRKRLVCWYAADPSGMRRNLAC